MLKKLLEHITQAGAVSIPALSQELGVSPELVEAMLADLVRAGYLQPVERCEKGECAQCSSAAACQPRRKMWMRLDRKQPE